MKKPKVPFLRCAAWSMQVRCEQRRGHGGCHQHMGPLPSNSDVYGYTWLGEFPRGEVRPWVVGDYVVPSSVTRFPWEEV